MSAPDYKDDRRGELTISRVVDAPRELVWQAFTEPGASRGVLGWTRDHRTGRIRHHGCPSGAASSFTMVASDGTEYPNRGEYVEVDKPSRIVFTEPTRGSPQRSPSPRSGTRRR